MIKIKNMKVFFKKHEFGNIFTGLSILISISIFIMLIILLNVTMELNSINTDSISNKQFKYTIEDYKNNIPYLTYSSLEELSNNITSTCVPYENSENEIKKRVNEKLEDENKKYKASNNLIMTSDVLSVKNGEDPFHIEIKILLQASKDDLNFNEIITKEVSLKNLKDPLPHIICGNHPTFSNDSKKIYYKESLRDYLAINGLVNPSSYENGSSHYLIKKCPLDPYTQHGENFNMKNCIENGYYHESADGSCYLCRLEGKGLCYHYGLETFIIPHSISTNDEYQSVCSSDHVIFSQYSYPGNLIIFYNYNSSSTTISEILFLDNGHKSKYGFN